MVARTMKRPRLVRSPERDQLRAAIAQLEEAKQQDAENQKAQERAYKLQIEASQALYKAKRFAGALTEEELKEDRLERLAERKNAEYFGEPYEEEPERQPT